MNRKTATTALIITVTIIASILSIHFMLVLLLGPSWQGMREMERDFDRNNEAIIATRDYLASIDFDFLRYPTFSGESGKMSTETSGDYFLIEDQHARNALDVLIRRGYQIISKEGNFIVFLRWRNKDNGRGIVYSINGVSPDESVLQFLTRLEPLPDEGWFYYLNSLKFLTYVYAPLSGLSRATNHAAYSTAAFGFGFLPRFFCTVGLSVS